MPDHGLRPDSFYPFTLRQLPRHTAGRTPGVPPNPAGMPRGRSRRTKGEREQHGVSFGRRRTLSRSMLGIQGIDLDTPE